MSRAKNAAYIDKDPTQWLGQNDRGVPRQGALVQGLRGMHHPGDRETQCRLRTLGGVSADQRAVGGTEHVQCSCQHLHEVILHLQHRQTLSSIVYTAGQQ